MTIEQSSAFGQAGALTGADGVLVVGMAHSGKTEVRRVIETSPEVFAMRRAPFWAASETHWGSLEVDGNLAACLADLQRHNVLDSWVTDVRETGSRYSAEPQRSYSGLLAYLHHAEVQHRRRRLWCVQVGGTETHLAGRLESLPGLRVVHTVRDPRDRLSVSGTSWLPGRRGRDLARWERSVQSAIDGREMFPDRYMVVTWEDLTDNLDLVASKIGDFIGCRLEPSPQHLPDEEKMMSNGALSGPHTVRAVSALLAAVGYESGANSRGMSIADFVEYAFFRLHRRSGARRRGGSRQVPVMVHDGE